MQKNEYLGLFARRPAVSGSAFASEGPSSDPGELTAGYGETLHTDQTIHMIVTTFLCAHTGIFSGNHIQLENCALCQHIVKHILKHAVRHSRAMDSDEE